MTKPRTAQQPATRNNEDDDEGVESSGAYPPAYPLFRDHDPPIEFGLVDYIIVQRVIDDAAARPGADKRSRYKTWPERFDPITTDEVTIADRCGGGVYDVRGIGAKGRTVAAARIELDGPPREYASTQQAPTPVAPPAPAAPVVAVQQAAPGVLSFTGLDPNMQAFVAMMQANSERAEKQLEAQRLAMKEEAQRAREDSNNMSERMVRMIEATVTRTAPPAPVDQQLLMRLIDRMDRQREREEDRADRRARTAARDERDDGINGEKVLEKVLEKGPELLLQLPGLQKRLGELIAPMFKDTAKEIVAGVLNEMAQDGAKGR